MTDSEAMILENVQRNRELRGEITQRVRAVASQWTPKPEEPKPVERELDTRPAPAVSAAELAEVHRRIDGLTESMRELAKAVSLATDNCAEAFGRQELRQAQSDAQIKQQIADLWKQLVGSQSSSSVTDLPNPLQGRSSSRVN